MKRAMAMVTKRVMWTNGDTTDNSHGKEGGRHLTVATMVGWGWRKGQGCLCYDWKEGGDAGNGPRFVCVLVCVERPQI